MLVLFLGAASTAQACGILPRQLSADAQIAAATDVTLVRVVRATPLPEPATTPQAASERLLEPMRPLWERDPRPALPTRIEYELVVEKRWRGPDQDRFTIVGDPHPATERAPQPEADSRERAFWEAGGGRLHGSWCVFTPSFVVGERYLVFLGARPLARDFEHIATIDGAANPRDRWLMYVDAKLGGK